MKITVPRFLLKTCLEYLVVNPLPPFDSSRGPTLENVLICALEIPPKETFITIDFSEHDNGGMLLNNFAQLALNLSRTLCHISSRSTAALPSNRPMGFRSTGEQQAPKKLTPEEANLEGWKEQHNVGPIFSRQLLPNFAFEWKTWDGPGCYSEKHLGTGPTEEAALEDLVSKNPDLPHWNEA